MEQNSNEIKDALVEVLQTFTEIKNFTLAQAPDVIHQLLLWKLCENIILALVFFVLVIYTYMGWKRLGTWWAKQQQKSDEDSEGFYYVGSLLLVSLFVLFGATTIYRVMESIKIIIAPKFYLIEYAANLIN